MEELRDLREGWAEQAREIGQMQQDKLDNMPDGLRDGDTGAFLQERADACEAWADEIEAAELPDPVDYEPDIDEGASEEDEGLAREDAAAALADAITATVDEIAALGPECS